MATTANHRNTALKEAMTKSQLLEALSESTGLQSVTSRDARWERSRFPAC